MIARFTLAVIEWAAATCAVLAAASAASTAAGLDIAIAGLAAIVAGLARTLAISRAAGRRFDGLLATLRAVAHPSNDAGGL